MRAENETWRDCDTPSRPSSSGLYTSEGAEEYGRIFAELRRLGRPMQQIDMQIGAIARTLPGCIVVSKDSDLLAIPGITVENWEA
ncbi:MAG TPA: type II toxin-antitoxin system VapC family toxin [Pirellulales bacterium]|nr:type II toxin-antitoxin system VapC family toxin [Pirellulales bacterium]